MLLEDKRAIVYGGGGAIGGAAARAFAGEGATVFLAGRTRAALQRVADDIARAGGRAETAEVDVLDQAAVDAHADDVAARAGGIDIALNAVGFMHVQGTPFARLTLDEFTAPIDAYARASFITAHAVARHMTRQGAGVILTISTVGSRMPVPGSLGYGTTCAAIEAFSRTLAGELGPSGVRVVCLRSDVIPESLGSSHVGRVFEGLVGDGGPTLEELVEGRAATGTLLGRFPTLAEVGGYAALVASDRAGAMTGAIANLSCGSLVD